MAVDHWRPFSLLTERWEPTRAITDIQEEMNRLFDGFFARPSAVRQAQRGWMPLVDVCETKEDLVVAVDLPGVAEKDVEVAVAGDVLTVRGDRRFEGEAEEENYLRLERAYGKFERAIPLPLPVQVDKVKATYRDGVLEIKLPKAEELKPRQIKIAVG